jgi:uncharacterized membrane protein HdeD (DUF308 family)
MKNFFYRADNHGVLLSILMVVLGLVLAIWPGHVMTSAMTILGIALLAGGALLIFSWYSGRNRDSSVITLAEGIVLAVAGLVVLIAPKFLISIVPLCVGAVITLNGIFNLAQALDQRKANYNRWTASLVMAILTIVLGLLIVFNPFSTMEMLVVAIGIIIIYNGVSNLLIELGYRKIYK